MELSGTSEENMNDEKGYVIRCHDLYDGSTDYRGLKGIISKSKSGLSASDTYTISGAKRALANMRRLCFEPDRYQYSIERLDEYYVSTFPSDGRDTDQKIRFIDKAFERLDELWNKNDFDNGDKMRINEVRAVLQRIKEDITEG